MNDDIKDLLGWVLKKEQLEHKSNEISILTKEVLCLFKKLKGFVKDAKSVDDQKSVFWAIDLFKMGVGLEQLDVAFRKINQEEWFPHIDYFIKKYILDFNVKRDYRIFIDEIQERFDGKDCSKHSQFLYNIYKIFWKRVGSNIEFQNMSNEAGMALFEECANELLNKIRIDGFKLESIPLQLIRLDEKPKNFTEEEREEKRRNSEFWINKIKAEKRMDVA